MSNNEEENNNESPRRSSRPTSRVASPAAPAAASARYATASSSVSSSGASTTARKPNATYKQTGLMGLPVRTVALLTDENAKLASTTKFLSKIVQKNHDSVLVKWIGMLLLYVVIAVVVMFGGQ